MADKRIVNVPSIGFTAPLPKLDSILPNLPEEEPEPSEQEEPKSNEQEELALSKEQDAAQEAGPEPISAQEAPALSKASDGSSEDKDEAAPFEAPVPHEEDFAQIPDLEETPSPETQGGKVGVISRNPISLPQGAAGPKHIQPVEDAARRFSGGKIAAAVALVLVGATAAAYGAGFFYYSEHLLPHSYCSGRDVSGLTISEASELTSTANWKMRIVEGDNEWTLSAQDVGLTLSEVNFGEVINQQNKASWPLNYIGSDSNRNVIEQQVTYDPEAVRAAVAALPCVTDETRTPQADAYPELAEDGRSYVVHSEALGSKVNTELIVQAVISELEGYVSHYAQTDGSTPSSSTGVPTVDIVTSNAYEQPVVTSENPSLLEAVATANKWLSAQITYDIDGLPAAEHLDASTIAGWVTVERLEDVSYDENGEPVPGTEGVRFEAVYHDDLVRDWLADMGEKYDTAFCGKTITTANGSSAYVVGGNSYGWITDEAAEFEQLTADISNGATVQRAFATKQQGKTPQAQFEGRYLEVSISDQHVWLFDNGQVIWDARTVTGSPSHPTVLGTFQIYKMERDTVLVGADENKDGKPDYESNVSYWMPFHGGYGLHDATGWRGDDPSNYGGSIRSYNGSHGCCNLTGPDAAYLYNMAFVGMTVYVH